MADLFEHPADLSVTAFNERNLVPRILRFADQPDAGRRGPDGLRIARRFFGRARLRRQRYTATQPLDRFFRWLVADLDHVNLRQMRRSMHQALGERAVVGEEQQAFTVEV